MNGIGISIVVTLVSGSIGAFIGTYFGAYLTTKREEAKKKEVRAIAIKAINVIKKYAKGENTYDMVSSDFNNTMSLAEKRTIIVVMHKLGIPVVVPPTSVFNVEAISFGKKQINSDELSAIAAMIEKGYCDHLFYLDPEKYFDENVRLRTVRSTAIRWVREIFSNSVIDRDASQIIYPNNWFDSFSYGEQCAISVFRKKTAVEYYFNIKNEADKDKMDQLVRDIEVGLWDTSLYWEIENYQNLTTSTSINSQMTLLMQSMMCGQIQKQ